MTSVTDDFNLFYFTFDTSILVLVFTRILTLSLFILSLFPLIFSSSFPSSVFPSFFPLSCFRDLTLQLLAFFLLSLHKTPDKDRWKSYCWVTSEMRLLWCDRPSACFKYQLTWSFSFTLLELCVCSCTYMATGAPRAILKQLKFCSPGHPAVTHLSASTLNHAFLLFPFHQAHTLVSTACSYCPLLLLALDFCYHLSCFHLSVLNRDISHSFC